MNLKNIRLSKNLTQNELATQLNVTRTTVTMWESGRSSPSILMIKKIAQVLDCTIEELLRSDN